MAENQILRIEGLSLEIEGKEILKGLNLSIKQGEKGVLFGPNGAGKSSLLYTILGFPGYKPKSGKIIFKGKDITRLPIDQRIKLGLGVTFQRPPAIRGIKLMDMLRICDPQISEEQVSNLSEKTKMEEFLGRDINLGFSGGEVKRSELLQVFAQKPDLVLFDEPDSGVDVENVQLLGKQIDGFLGSRAGLIITHQGYILDFIKATRACVLFGGEIICHGDAQAILKDIRQKGYAGCVTCRRPKDE